MIFTGLEKFKKILIIFFFWGALKLFPYMEHYSLTHSFGREKKGKNQINKNNQQKCNADAILPLDTGEMLTAKVQANLQIPSPPNQQSSHPRHVTWTRLHEAATEKQRHKILSALLLWSSIYCTLTLHCLWIGKAILRDQESQQPNQK